MGRTKSKSKKPKRRGSLSRGRRSLSRRRSLTRMRSMSRRRGSLSRARSRSKMKRGKGKGKGKRQRKGKKKKKVESSSDSDDSDESSGASSSESEEEGKKQKNKEDGKTAADKTPKSGSKADPEATPKGSVMTRGRSRSRSRVRKYKDRKKQEKEEEEANEEDKGREWLAPLYGSEKVDELCMCIGMAMVPCCIAGYAHAKLIDTKKEDGCGCAGLSAAYTASMLSFSAYICAFGGLRKKYRERMNIEGTATNDYCVSCYSCFCVPGQILRDMEADKERKQKIEDAFASGLQAELAAQGLMSEAELKRIKAKKEREKEIAKLDADDSDTSEDEDVVTMRRTMSKKEVLARLGELDEAQRRVDKIRQKFKKQDNEKSILNTMKLEDEKEERPNDDTDSDSYSMEESELDSYLSSALEEDLRVAEQMAQAYVQQDRFSSKSGSEDEKETDDAVASSSRKELAPTNKASSSTFNLTGSGPSRQGMDTDK